ncbi:integral membrane protein [Neisseria meningitidis]|uniref:Integral membrane protein n=1 Tax=Neisseria meningitidis TaxID=487 RepID=X5EQV4_NEIME|nr:integral membrane protein [Neisseria meningitidis]
MQPGLWASDGIFSEWRHSCRRRGSRMGKGGDIVVGNGKNMPHHCWCWVAWCSVWAV